jgi:hypothetical protein
MPHKESVVDLMRRGVRVAPGFAGPARRFHAPGGRPLLLGDMFDGEGFERGPAAHGPAVCAARRRGVVGRGGRRLGIAESLAGAGHGRS